MSATTGSAQLTWYTAGGSARGSAHIANDLPNEDAWSSSEPGPVGVIAVADGHGSKRCCRSAAGARLACEAVVEVLSAAVEPDASAESLAAGLPVWGERVVKLWRRRVDEDAARAPFQQHELELLGSVTPTVDQTRMAYGTTLLAACGTRRAVGALQIGDGDIIVIGPTGEKVFRPVPDDPRNVGHVTTSLSDGRATEHLRVATVDLTNLPVLAVMAATDGYGGAFSETQWWHRVGRDLADRAAAVDPSALSAQIPSWLDEPAKVAGDDATLALLLATTQSGEQTAPLRNDVPPSPSPSPSPTPPPSPEAVPAAPSVVPARGGHTRRALAAAAVAGLAIGALGGWSAHSSSSNEPTDTAALQVTTTSVPPDPTTSLDTVPPASAETSVGEPFTLVSDQTAALVTPTGGEPRIELVAKEGERAPDMRVAYDESGGYWAVDGEQLIHEAEGEDFAPIQLEVTIGALVVRYGQVWMLTSDGGRLLVVQSDQCVDDCVPECFDVATGARCIESTDETQP